MERVNTLSDVLKIAKPTKEELAVINYSGQSARLGFARDAMIVSLISEVLNEGHKFKMMPDEQRHYPFFWIKSSGLGFDKTLYDGSFAETGSASRLCLKTPELARHAGTKFKKYYQNFIMRLDNKK